MIDIKEKKFSKERIRWCGPDTYTVNDKAKSLSNLFNDPNRVPYYDTLGGYWDLSTKFSINDNESKEQ
jgi:hypothetical protein